MTVDRMEIACEKQRVGALFGSHIAELCMGFFRSYKTQSYLIKFTINRKSRRKSASFFLRSVDRPTRAVVFHTSDTCRCMHACAHVRKTYIYTSGNRFPKLVPATAVSFTTKKQASLDALSSVLRTRST